MPQNLQSARLLVVGPEADLHGLIVNLLEREGRGTRLAIVAKDPGNLVRSLLERHGHQVHVSPSHEALEAVVSAQADLVVVDLAALEGLMDEIQSIQAASKKTGELIPICAECKNVRNPDNSWKPIESYLQASFAVEFTHTLCPKHVGPSDSSGTGIPIKAG